VVFVELTYHTFNPAAREGRSIRYPELPRLLGVALPPEAARLLDLRPPDAPGPLPALDAALSRYWLLWRQRDALDARLFGGRPRTALDRVAAQALRGLPSTATVAADEAAAAEAKAGRRAASFDALDPRVQSVALRAYSMNASFTIDPRDPEVRLLRLLAASLAADGTRAVFYMTPLNRQVIADYELIDPKRYAANVATLREAIAPSGFPLLDYNSGRIELPSSLFADISHTTDAGGRAFGKLLARDSERYVWGEGR
jgi:hypothetical protein